MGGSSRRSRAARVARRSAALCGLGALAAAGWATAGLARQADSLTFCVAAPSCTGTPEPTLLAALAAAGGDPGTNTIQLGPGTFTGSGGADPSISDAGSGPVRLVGVGNGLDGGPATLLAAPVALSDPGSSVASLAIRDDVPRT